MSGDIWLVVWCWWGCKCTRNTISKCTTRDRPVTQICHNHGHPSLLLSTVCDTCVTLSRSSLSPYIQTPFNLLLVLYKRFLSSFFLLCSAPPLFFLTVFPPSVLSPPSLALYLSLSVFVYKPFHLDIALYVKPYSIWMEFYFKTLSFK